MRGPPRRDPHPALQRRSGNTITVRPQARRGVGTVTTPNGPEEGTVTPAAVSPNASLSPEGPPKKRYPTAEEITVIGGYLALARSCLAKNDPHRKKV
ncbi:PPR18 protein, partial [Syrrhaptes paradoxus]|nr:PPR18 protein [Syrrhaptes paradoxus]